ncbi:MAG: phosphoribosylanthranilate isomerase [Fimbriimonadaceae bacterium]|nr:MAG: phosphoribosylanthranilate isomerase [Armatimonadetes bacterium OLB18]WKZ81533.1 MAG: phosphoribosylanthranilate isomerase [Fimbriimonadaceae bacterium]
MTRVKICGLKRREDVECAVEAGADALGFVFEPTSPRFVGDEGPQPWLAEFELPKVAVLGPARPIYNLERFAWAQVIGPAHPSWPTGFRRAAVLRLGPTLDLESALDSLDLDGAFAIHLDAHRNSEYGGTGETIDWDLAAEIVARIPKPVILAGGLTPENVARAIERVRPWMVDVSSGVEDVPGVKSPSKVRAFVAAAKGA